MSLGLNQPAPAPKGYEPNFLPPPGLSVSLLKSLFVNVRDSIAPKRLPPLQLTSRPLNVGMLVGDILEMPWYRTILKNLGDAISPETLPPLQLESEPVEVELISDMTGWWRSLLRNLADAVAPERLPALRLSSSPVNPEMASQELVTPRWSSLIEGPKVFPSARWVASLDLPEAPAAAPMRTILLQLPPLDVPAAEDPVTNSFEHRLVLQLQRSIHRSHIREFLWVGLIVAEVTVILVAWLAPR